MSKGTQSGTGWKAVVIASCFAVAFGVATAEAVSVTPGNNPQANEQNVLLNGGDTGQQVAGELNQTHQSFTFSSNEVLTVPSNGQARIEAVDGSFTLLNIAATDAGVNFQDLIVNIDLAGTGQQSGSVVFSIDLIGGGNFVSSAQSLAQGNNFFTIVADAGERITAVTMVESGNNEIESVAQIRISGVAECPTCPPLGTVPEPGTLALLGASLLGFVGFAARRLNRR